MRAAGGRAPPFSGPAVACFGGWGGTGRGRGEDGHLRGRPRLAGVPADGLRGGGGGREAPSASPSPARPAAETRSSEEGSALGWRGVEWSAALRAAQKGAGEVPGNPGGTAGGESAWMLSKTEIRAGRSEEGRALRSCTSFSRLWRLCKCPTKHSFSIPTGN